jgi:hypothetical protein
MRRFRTLLAATAAVAMASFTGVATAQSAAVQSFGGGLLSNTAGNDLPFTVGWSFTANNNLFVTSLGFWDQNGNGLEDSHRIGIWSAAGSLLTSATVGSGTSGTLYNGFRYVDLSPFALTAGMRYIIGAEVPRLGDAYMYSPSSVTTSSDITFGDGLRSDDQSGFALPNSVSNSGRFGPNFLYTVPEPSSILLLASGMLFMAGVSRTRKQQS